MRNTAQVFPIVGLACTVAVAAYMVVQLDAQSPAVTARDFTNAAIAEVRDAQGRVVLQGKFAAVDEDDEDVERKAMLATTGADADASGEAEIEYAKVSPRQQEIEFMVRNLDAGLPLTLVVDGVDVAMVTTDSRGRADVEVIVTLPGAGATATR